MFSTIVIVIVVLYVFGYTGMIVYDLFIKKDPVEFMPKPKDVEVDISDEAGQFKPITVGQDEPKAQPKVTGEPVAQEKKEGTSHNGTTAKEENTNAGKSADSRKASDGEIPADNSKSSADPPAFSQSKSEGGRNAQQQKHESADDIGPRPTDAETKKRISELVRARRQEILAEEMAVASLGKSKEDASDGNSNMNDKRANEKSDENTADELASPEVRIVEPGIPDSPKVSHAASRVPSKDNLTERSRPTKPPIVPKHPRPPKPPKQPKHHNDAYIDLEVAIDKVRQYSKLEGAQTAEQVSEEAKRVSEDDTLMVLKKINSDWDKIEKSYVPDEGEQQAMEKAKNSSRDTPPQFNML